MTEKRKYTLPYMRGGVRKTVGNITENVGKLIWAITKDNIDWRTSASDEEVEAIKAEGCIYHFKMYDDDDIMYFEGYCIQRDIFSPLDDFGMPTAGCTRIDYRQPNAEYETL